MYELRISVTKVLGTCTADPPMSPGDHFHVCDGDLTIPDGGYICVWALQSMLPLITPKEREIAEADNDDWMWRVHHVQCPDPKGRVIFRIDRVRKLEKTHGSAARGSCATAGQAGDRPKAPEAVCHDVAPRPSPAGEPAQKTLRDLRVVVERGSPTCTSGMAAGDHFLLRDGRLYIPPGRHFCLYALHAALPLLPAKQRHVEDWDWMAEDHTIICPDPAGNVILRIGFDDAPR